MTEPLPAPGLDKIDKKEREEGDRQHDGRDAGGAGIIILFEFHDDQQRRDFRDISNVAGDEDDRPIFTDSAREGEREARQ
jgi:hypothetical protein